jgi:hypothetical protein
VLRWIEATSQPDRAQVNIWLAQPVHFTAGSVKDPDGVYVDLQQASAGPGLTLPTPSPDDPFIRQIRISRRAHGTTRVVVDLKAPAEYSVVLFKGPPRLLLVLRRANAPATQQQPDQAPAAPVRDTLPAASAVISPSPNPPANTEADPSTISDGLVSLPVPAASAPVLAPPSNPAVDATAAVPAGDMVRGRELIPVPTSSRSLIIPRVKRPPVLQDFLQGLPAEPGVKITGFQQREPGDGKPVSQLTTAYLSYDERNLYVVFVCQQGAASVRGHLSKRDDIANDDQVSIYLDTFRDRQHAYVFTANPLGVQGRANAS